jgi:hypothetical protein
VLGIPPGLAPILRAWWERSGCPESGPVFPSRHGKRAGDFKKSGGGFAARLRRALFRAGVVRMPPVAVAAIKAGMRSDLGKHVVGTQPGPNPSDTLYFETAATLPVDFHSFRRAFNTALAEADVSVQRAMALASHSDAKTHMRYVMRTRGMRTIPEAAPPGIRAEIMNDFSGRSRDRTCDFVRVKEGSETTNSIIARPCADGDLAPAERDSACFVVSYDDSSRKVAETPAGCMCNWAVGQATGEGTPSFAGGADWAPNPSVPPAVVNSDESARDVGLEESAPAPPIDEVEIALAKALLEASIARRFDVVEQLARELEARRVTRTRTSVRIGARRRGPV